MKKEDSFVDLPDVRDKHDDTHKITLCFATLSLPPFVTAIGLISGALLFSIIAAFLAETSFKLVTEHSICMQCYHKFPLFHVTHLLHFSMAIEHY